MAEPRITTRPPAQRSARLRPTSTGRPTPSAPAPNRTAFSHLLDRANSAPAAPALAAARGGVAAGAANPTIPARATTQAATTATTEAFGQLPYADLMTRVAERHGLDPALLAAVARNESGFNPRAVSQAGAQGLMQLMPATARALGVADPFDPAQNLDGGARFLSDMLRRYKGDTSRALAAYNAGPGAVDRHGGIPPFAETRAYVPRVLRTYQQLTANRAGGQA